jgi:urease accessory protein
MNVLRRRASGFALMPMLLLWMLLISTAQAHLTVEGVGDVEGGMLHPLMTPAHVLILLGLALLFGMRIPLNLKAPMCIMAVLAAIALALTATGRIPVIPQPLLIGLALVIASLVALDRRLHPAVYLVLYGFAAIGIGLDSVVEKGSATVIAKTLIGTWATLNIFPAYVAVCVSHGAKKQWSRTAIRILGSWIIAISILVLAFALRK